jgi:glucosylceramidase
MTAGILLAAMAATHFASVEGDEWKSSPLQSENVSERSGGSEAANSTLELFSTDGKTPRAGSVPWRAWGTTFNELDLDALRMLKPAEQEEILKKLFAPKGELRFTRGRLTMNANDYSREWYSCSEKEGDFELKHFNIEHDKKNQVALIKMAQKFQPKLTFWVSPWTPPAWMKINKDYCVVSSRFNNQPKEKDALLFGGDTSEIDPNEMWLQGDRSKLFPRRLATQNYFIQEPEYLQAYAEMFVRFVELYRKEGVPIDMVMYQNEAYSYTPYPGCPWTAEGTIRFNRDYLAPTLKAKAPGVKLYLGTFNTNRRELIAKILDAPGISDCIEGIGFQWEGRQAMEAFAAEGRYAGLHKVCSESECGNGRMDWKAGEHTSWLIFQNLGNGADEWYNWNFILCDMGRSRWGWNQNALIRVDSKTKEFSYRPEYYAVRHFAQFIKPGAVQLAYSPWRDSTEALCYRNPDGGIVVVATNWANGEKRVSFSVAGKTYAVNLKPHSFNTFTIK